MTITANIMVCDDDEKTTYFLEQILEKKANFKVIKTHSGEECLKEWNKSIDVTILDFRLPNMNGLKVLKEIKKKDPYAVVIMATGHSTEKLVIESLRHGAYNYIKKPYDLDYLLSTAKEAVLESSQRKTKLGLSISKHPSNKSNYQNSTKSDSVKEIMSVIEKVSQKNISILLTGNSGTGKEFFATAIHNLSNRSSESFIPVNCPAIPATLAESELFGHEKGSFTGADSQKKGKFELANNGIIFLDEIADLSMEIQSKLLRVLQEREIYRVGGSKAIPIDVLLLSATSKDLRKEIDEGRFRADLYYRIADINLEIPRLNERREDIQLLSEKFILDYSKENDEPIKEILPEALSLLENYSWPGNIRELKSFIRKIMILIPGNQITKDDVLNFLQKQAINFSEDISIQTTSHKPDIQIQEKVAVNPTSTNVKDMEKNLIIQSLEKNKNNMTTVAKDLGISRSTLYRKLKKYEIDH